MHKYLGPYPYIEYSAHLEFFNEQGMENYWNQSIIDGSFGSSYDAVLPLLPFTTLTIYDLKDSIFWSGTLPSDFTSVSDTHEFWHPPEISYNSWRNAFIYSYEVDYKINYPFVWQNTNLTGKIIFGKDDILVFDLINSAFPYINGIDPQEKIEYIRNLVPYPVDFILDEKLYQGKGERLFLQI